MTHHAAALLFNRRRKVKGVNQATLRMREFVPTAGGIKILFDPQSVTRAQGTRVNLSRPICHSPLLLVAFSCACSCAHAPMCSSPVLCAPVSCGGFSGCCRDWKEKLHCMLPLLYFNTNGFLGEDSTRLQFYHVP